VTRKDAVLLGRRLLHAENVLGGFKPVDRFNISDFIDGPILYAFPDDLSEFNSHPENNLSEGEVESKEKKRASKGISYYLGFANPASPEVSDKYNLHTVAHQVWKKNQWLFICLFVYSHRLFAHIPFSSPLTA
jgi:hypothetical protein